MIMTPIVVSFGAPLFGRPGWRRFYPGIIMLRYRLLGWELKVIATSKMYESSARVPWWRMARTSSRALEYLIFDYEHIVSTNAEYDQNDASTPRHGRHKTQRR